LKINPVKLVLVANLAEETKTGIIEGLLGGVSSEWPSLALREISFLCRIKKNYEPLAPEWRHSRPSDEL